MRPIGEAYFYVPQFLALRSRRTTSVMCGAVSAYTGPENLSSWREISTIKTTCTFKFSIRMCCHLWRACLGIESTRLYSRMTMLLYIHCRTRGVEALSEDQGINRIRWPAQSPDLSPIENLWNDIGMAIIRECRVTKRHLTQCILTTWANITADNDLG